MKIATKLLASLAAAALLTACASGPKLASAGIFEAGSYSVPLSQDWTAFNIKTGKGKPAQLLTVDGTVLNSVYLYSDLKEGDSLMKERKRDNPVPKFTTDLSELELVEFLADSLERGHGLLDVQTMNVEPSSFKGAEAIQFDFTAVNENGLKISGSSLLGVEDEKLNIVLYMAPTIHYYGKLKGDVSAMMTSLAS